ncbi:hypothetical protein BC938DRAFT_482728 [Jimgerdemannia flammicorona]|uniref:DhaK domain-containing protein n=1 Tax=Jimgerdemannia flammicorona TaxID=994334 RepID=A0A433QDF6_9FUNG|nr:hypothetical protein BC938DRAFT_482728 [Jimgerdemannia flammicorona]
MPSNKLPPRDSHRRDERDLDCPNRSALVTVMSATFLCHLGSIGYEPAHTTFVGPSMLTAAVIGRIFALPTAVQILAALRAARSPRGTLVIIKNYTGDLSAFWPGHGATFEQGRDAAQYIAPNTTTIGVDLDHCHLPGSSSLPMARLSSARASTTSLGNAKRASCLSAPLRTTISTPCSIQPTRTVSTFHQGPSRLLVNNLGGTPALELGAVVKEATEYLVSRKGSALSSGSLRLA